jgi:ABC-type multidrug transport system fused ATPase/permease subunit
MKKYFKEYRVEIVIVLLILVGIFLLFERLDLKSLLASGFQLLWTSLKNLLSLIRIGVNFYIFNLSLSDFIGWILLFLAVALAVGVSRYRFSHSPTFQATVCPKCGGDLHRVHRKYFDRLLSRTLLPHARRYRCASPECRWTGLRHPRHRHQQQQVSN